MKEDLVLYGRLLDEVKTRISQAQTRAVMSANAEMILMYWDIGRMIDERQRAEGWGAKIIPRLSKDIRNELPEVKGFSERNLKLMVQFYHEYPDLNSIGQPAVAQIGLTGPQEIGQPAVARSGKPEGRDCLALQIPWAHNVHLMVKIKEPAVRAWYMEQILVNGWSRDVLALMISSDAHKRQGKALSNFDTSLPHPQSDLVQQALKDPYVFDFLTLAEPFQERELETGLMDHLQKFLVELGQGFAFVGRQYRLEIGDDDFYIDLLFYHLKLRCFILNLTFQVLLTAMSISGWTKFELNSQQLSNLGFIVIDLKKGDFKPEHAGKMNFYCSAVDDLLMHSTDQQTIGLILCQKKNKVVAEYALGGMNKPIGVSEYELTRTLPEDLRSSLPSIEEIEAELSGGTKNGKKRRGRKHEL